MFPALLFGPLLPEIVDDGLFLGCGSLKHCCRIGLLEHHFVDHVHEHGPLAGLIHEERSLGIGQSLEEGLHHRVVLVFLGKCGRGGEFADALQPEFLHFGGGEILQELDGCLKLLALRAAHDAVGPVGRVVGLDALVARKFGDAPFEVLDGVERSDAEGTVDVHGTLAGLEGGDIVGGEVGIADLVFGDEVRVPLEGRHAIGIGIAHLAVIRAVWQVSELAEEDFTQPAVALSGGLHQEARLDKIALRVELGQFLRVGHQFLEGPGRSVRIVACFLEKLLVPDERKGADRGGRRVVLSAEIHGLGHEGIVSLVEVGLVELGRGEFLQIAALHVHGEPSVEERDDIGAFAGGNRSRDLLVEALVREGHLLDLDSGIGGFELLDEFVDELHLGLVEVLPVRDRHRLRSRGDHREEYEDGKNQSFPCFHVCLLEKSGTVA
ncbi:hypothetical protein SDC9_31648 [bioreactor metagenome]|uniref:NAD-specific glutamate dehydrogenase n=1 Tax=bioreactor metagenome TaxID=1076179 RepID=A0A644V3Q7_9ZZZZ